MNTFEATNDLFSYVGNVFYHPKSCTAYCSEMLVEKNICKK